MLELNKIHCMDCIEGMKNIADESIDLIFADPPFNIDKDYGLYKDNLELADYECWLDSWITECFRVLKPTGSIYIMQYPKWTGITQRIMSKIGYLQNIIIWRNNKMPNANRFVIGYQPILFFTKEEKDYTFNRYAEKKPLETFIPGIKKEVQDQEVQLTDIWMDIPFVNGGCIPNPEAILSPGTKSKVHPCQMPLKLIRRIIKFSSDEGDLILDPFMGSGTTAVAAKQLNRNFIGFELSQEYVDIANKRLQQENLKSWLK